MRRALIGSTGFVGSNLGQQVEFHSLFNSSNIEEVRGQRFDEVVCAGAPAEKWRANRDPASDRLSIERLVQCLQQADAREIVLISTVDVYPAPLAVTEDSAIDDAALLPYGRHRLQLELELQKSFPTTVIRLPALFGKGLKKNIVYDLMHDHMLEQVDSRGMFQFYDLANLWTDIEVARSHGIRLLNLATEPLSVSTIAEQVFGRSLGSVSTSPPPKYDVRSVHAEKWGGERGYLYDRGRVLNEMTAFVREAMKRREE